MFILIILGSSPLIFKGVLGCKFCQTQMGGTKSLTAHFCKHFCECDFIFIDLAKLAYENQTRQTFSQEENSSSELF